MLKNARLFEDRIKEQVALKEYDIKYQWINYWWYTGEFNISKDDNGCSFNFVSVNEKDELQGVICAEFNRAAHSVSGLWAMSFIEGGSLVFGRDLLDFFDKMFYEYNFNRIEWGCYVDNPAARGYKKFIKKYGGEIIGTRHQSSLLMDGKLHDSYIFEIMREDYVKHRNEEKIRKELCKAMKGSKYGFTVPNTHLGDGDIVVPWYQTETPFYNDDSYQPYELIPPLESGSWKPTNLSSGSYWGD